MFSKKPKILSTKKLTTTQKELFINSNIAIVESDFITTQPIDIEAENGIENAIFTSKNAVKSILKYTISIKNSFCVGDKTEALLIENGFTVVEKTYNAKDLAKKISKNHPEKKFTFFCGNKRRKELPILLNTYKIKFKEIEVYKTQLTPKTIDADFDGVLFFSPSAVKSFVLNNDVTHTIAFCIGKTTETEVKKYTKNIITTDIPTIENLMIRVIEHFKNRRI
jgi:uroporphyrinogen-III synthase